MKPEHVVLVRQAVEQLDSVCRDAVKTMMDQGIEFSDAITVMHAAYANMIIQTVSQRCMYHASEAVPEYDWVVPAEDIEEMRTILEDMYNSPRVMQCKK